MAGSIWASGFLGSALSSEIDAILDKEEFELEELLKEPRLLEELERPNQRLIEYLSKKETIEKMLGILLEFDEDENFRTAHAVAEVFSSGVEEINQVLVGTETEYLLDLFEGLANAPGNLGARKAGYIHNLLTTLVKDDEDLTLVFLNRYKGLVMRAMLCHLDERAMAAAFKALLYAGCYDQDSGMGMGMGMGDEDCDIEANMGVNGSDGTNASGQEGASGAGQSGWATDEATVQAIVKKVFEGGPERAQTHNNASKILRAFVGEGVELSEEFMPHPHLRAHLSSEDTCILLANGIFHSNPPSAESSKEAAFKILTALVGSSTFRDSDSDASGVDMSEVPSIKYPCAAINHEQMCADLRAEGEEIETSFNGRVRCIGPYRLAVVKYLALVFASESLAVTRELATNGVVDACLQLLFDYPWSSMLHVEVLCIVQFIIRSYDLLMQLRVFGKFNLLTKILDHLEEEQDNKARATSEQAAADASTGGSSGTESNGDGNSAARKKMMTTTTNRGCLYRICMDVENYLVGMSGEDSEDGTDAMEASTSPIRIWSEKHKVRWQNFVIGTLRGVEERQERHLAGLPIPCPDGLNVIYESAANTNSNSNGGGLSDSMRGLALESNGNDMQVGDMEGGGDASQEDMNWE